MRATHTLTALHDEKEVPDTVAVEPETNMAPPLCGNGHHRSSSSKDADRS